MLQKITANLIGDGSLKGVTTFVINFFSNIKTKPFTRIDKTNGNFRESTLPDKKYYISNKFKLKKKHYNIITLDNSNKTTNTLRSNVFFNKSKFSRNRQICINIALLGVYLNIIFINELHRAFYNISIDWSNLLYNVGFIFFFLFFFKKMLTNNRKICKVL